MAGAPLLEIDGLTFRYRRASDPAIRDVSLTLDPGEVLLVAGPSGCGKSTLIRAINGLIPHSYSGELTGTVRIGGRQTTDLRLRDLAGEVGTVLQDPRKQIVASTVVGELAFAPENLGMPRGEIAARIAQVVPETGIGHLIGRTADQLSGGESQALAVAGALMMQPRLLVLDEPLANLDAEAAHRLLAQVRKLAERGTAVVIVEHRVEDVMAAQPDRVLYLDRGRPVYLGSLDGFLEVADPAEVKLPFSVALQRLRGRVSPKSAGAVLPARQLDGEARLEWREVSAAYDERSVLHSVSSRLGRYETVAVLGPNGSGKTTLFKAAIGLVPRTGGDVLVDGRTVAGRSVADLAGIFGYVFQNPSQMLFAPTVEDELLFGPRNLGRDPTSFDRLVGVTLDRVGLGSEEQIRSRPPLTLSFGQQKRLALAVALAIEPSTLVLDEPSAGQDHRSATEFMREVERVAGLESVYFVTHDADLALANADRILLLREGQIVADGAPLEVIADRQRWEGCNLRYTSLMEANAQWGSRTGRFLEASALAHWLVDDGGEARGGNSTVPGGAGVPRRMEGR